MHFSLFPEKNQGSVIYNKFMIKFLSDLIGANVVLYQEQAKVGPISDVVFSPADGALLGFFCLDPVSGLEKVVPSNEIQSFHQGYVVISGYDSMSMPNEVIRIEQALAEKPKIIGARVYTQSGQYLGKVHEATINLDFLCLDHLYVNPPFSFSFLAKDLLISAKKIVEFQHNKIIVSDELIKLTEPKVEIGANTAARQA